MENNFKVHGEWLCDDYNNIVKRPLSFWFEYYNLIPIEWNGYQMWRSLTTTKCMDIEKSGGYGLRHDEYFKYKERMFFVGNADLDNPKLREYTR